MPDRLRRLLGSRHAPSGLFALGLLLSLPAIPLGVQADDHVLKFTARTTGQPLSLFEAPSRGLAHSRLIGDFAWWSSPRLAIRLLRPLSSLTHFVEYRLWPEQVWMPHVVNGVLYASLVLVAAKLYRRLLPDPRFAGLAALMFAIDAGHAPAVGWVSSRNTVLSALFTLLALLAYARGPQPPRAARQAVSALCVALSLGASEGGAMSLAYLAAYVAVYGSGGFRERLRSLALPLCVFGAWASYYFVNHFGIRGSSWYREFDTPFTALIQGIADLPVWFLSLLGPSFTGAIGAIPASRGRVLALGLVLPLFIGLVLKAPRTRVNSFFALGAVLCLPPLLMTVPQDRLLLSPSFGTLGLLASLLDSSTQARGRWAQGHRSIIAFFKLIFAPLMFIPALSAMVPFENGTRALVAAVAKSRAREVVLVNAPNELLTLYAAASLEPPSSVERTRTTHQLYAGFAPLTVERIDDTTLEVTPLGGWGRLPIERVFGAPRDAPQAGAELAFSNLRVSVLETNAEHLPSRVRFHFATTLESDERTWLSWQGKEPKPWHPPPVGTKVSLPALSLFTSL
jgi:hypothetical protein